MSCHIMQVLVGVGGLLYQYAVFRENKYYSTSSKEKICGLNNTSVSNAIMIVSQSLNNCQVQGLGVLWGSGHRLLLSILRFYYGLPILVGITGTGIVLCIQQT
jgi:hypothetical protein